MTGIKQSATMIKANISRDRILMTTVQLLGIGFLVLFLVLPAIAMFSLSMKDTSGINVGLSHYIKYFSTPALLVSLTNSLWISTLVAIIVVPVSFFFAFALTRTCLPGKELFRGISQIPILAPSLLPSIALIYLFGNHGFLKPLLFGHTVYGPIGIVIAQVFFNLPQAVMILTASLNLTDKRLYETAEVLGTSRLRVWTTIILPEARYGLISSFFVVFTKSITDFGSVIVIGGKFNVLATDIYKQVIGQQNFNMGAVIGVILLVPAIVAFIGNQIVEKRQLSSLTVGSVPFVPQLNKKRDVPFLIYSVIIGSFLVLILATATWGSFIQYWPYNLTLTLQNYNFSSFDPGGWSPFFNAIWMSLIAAGLGTIITFIGAYSTERAKGVNFFRSTLNLLGIITMAVPGLVLGLSYILFFNSKSNPFNFLLGTLFLMAVSTIVHYYSVCHLSAVAALKQIDKEFEAVSESLKVSVFRTFFKVTVPISSPVILEIFSYLFFASMASVSALIFLYTPSTRVAAIAVVNISDSGRIAGAAAMAMTIVGGSLLFKLIHTIASNLIQLRLQRWRNK